MGWGRRTPAHLSLSVSLPPLNPGGTPLVRPRWCPPPPAKIEKGTPPGGHTPHAGLRQGDGSVPRPFSRPFPFTCRRPARPSRRRPGGGWWWWVGGVSARPRRGQRGVGAVGGGEGGV